MIPNRRPAVTRDFRNFGLFHRSLLTIFVWCIVPSGKGCLLAAAKKAPGMEHGLWTEEAGVRSRYPEFRKKPINIDFIWVTSSLNRRMSNKEFRISKWSLHHSAVPCSAVRYSVFWTISRLSSDFWPQTSDLWPLLPYALCSLPHFHGPRTSDYLLAPLQELLLRATRDTDQEESLQLSALS